MAPSSGSEKAAQQLHALQELIATTQTLLEQFHRALSVSDSSTTSSSSATSSKQNESPHPLELVGTAATLLKANTTKLTLLLRTEPFTPSAITTVLRDVAGTCLPAMMGAVEICTVEAWGRLMRVELRHRVKRTVDGIAELVDKIKTAAENNGKVSAAVNGNGASKKKPEAKVLGKDNLADTGVVWNACDELISLKQSGIAGLAVKKAEAYRETITDALEELKDWAEDVSDVADDADEDEDQDDALSAEGDADGDSIEHMFSAGNKMPRDDHEMKTLVDLALKRLKMIGMLYQAVGKRRLKTFEVGSLTEAERSTRLQVLDELLGLLKEAQELVDELAMAFYDLSHQEAKRLLQECQDTASKAATLVKQNWEGKEDEFTAWSNKWTTAVNT